MDDTRLHALPFILGQLLVCNWGWLSYICFVDLNTQCFSQNLLIPYYGDNRWANIKH